MIVRTLLTIFNLATFVAVIAVLLLFPQYGAFAFYFLVGWMVASLVLFYQPWASRQIGARAASATSGAGPAPSFPNAPLPSAATPPAALDFCVYCAAPLGPNVTKCTACGRDRGAF
jgi:hypothetical protein